MAQPRQGAVLTREEYYAYGGTAYAFSDTGFGGSVKRYRYSGKECDSENGLYYFGARYYAAWLGRWTAGDPVFHAGRSVYEFCSGNPITRGDADGRDDERVHTYKFAPQEIKAQLTPGTNQSVDTKAQARVAEAAKPKPFTDASKAVTEQKEIAQKVEKLLKLSPAEWAKAAIDSFTEKRRGARTMSIDFNKKTETLTISPGGYGEKSYTMPATSGRPGVTDQTLKDAGPIPSGTYNIEAKEISDPNLPGDIARQFKGDWGDWRVRLHPDPGTDTFGRENFFLHGGKFPGSAGCIDFGGGPSGTPQTDRLLNDLRRDTDGRIPVLVH